MTVTNGVAHEFFSRFISDTEESISEDQRLKMIASIGFEIEKRFSEEKEKNSASNNFSSVINTGVLEHNRLMAEHFMEQFKEYSASTVKMFHDQFSGDSSLVSFLLAVDSDESTFRSSLRLAKHSDHGSFDTLVSGICSAIGVEDLSRLSSADECQTMLDKIIHVAKADRSKNHNANPVTKSIFDLIKGDDFSVMTSELASVIVEFPHHTGTILRYASEHNGGLRSLDHEHLKIYLQNHSPALGEGVL